MIRVTVDLWPGGDSSRAKTLGTMDIWNNSQLAPVSRYGYEVRDEGGAVLFKGTRVIHRRSAGVWSLIEAVLGRVRAEQKLDEDHNVR